MNYFCQSILLLVNDFLPVTYGLLGNFLYVCLGIFKRGSGLFRCTRALASQPHLWRFQSRFSLAACTRICSRSVAEPDDDTFSMNLLNRFSGLEAGLAFKVYLLRYPD